MLFQEPDPKTRTVDDFDFTMVDGVFMSFTVDKELGDSMESLPDAFIVHLTAKPTVDGTEMMPAEDVTLFKRNIITIQHKTKEITEQTAAQKLEYIKTFKGLVSKTVQ